MRCTLRDCGVGLERDATAMQNGQLRLGPIVFPIESVKILH